MVLKKLIYALFVLIFGCVAGNEEDSIQTVTPDQLQQMLSSNTVELIDVRNTDEFIEGHISGAKNIPLPILKADQIQHDANKKIVVQCKSGKRGGQAYLLLKKMMPSADIYNLKGGITEWQNAKLPIVDVNTTLPIVRQTQIAAGAIVLLGTIASCLLSPVYWIVPVFVGCGLIFAGITGWCGMAKLLSHLPWNS